MPPVFVKPRLEDIQEVTLTIPAQETKGSVVISHGLQDHEDNDIPPDTIVPELIDYPGFVADSEPPIQAFVIKRSSPEDGTYTLWGVVQIGSDHEIDYTLRVTSIVWHSVQGDDHTA
jgi:hypothetical protein